MVNNLADFQNKYISDVSDALESKEIDFNLFFIFVAH